MDAPSFQLRFRVWAPDLDPAAITGATGIEPSRTFLVGEFGSGPRRAVAGWEWFGSTATDDRVLWDEFIATFEQHTTAIKAACTGTTVVNLSISGLVLGDLLRSAQDASRLGWDDDGIYPSIAGSRVELSVPSSVLKLLAVLDAELATHINAEARLPE